MDIIFITKHIVNFYGPENAKPSPILSWIIFVLIVSTPTFQGDSYL